MLQYLSGGCVHTTDSVLTPSKTEVHVLHTYASAITRIRATRPPFNDAAMQEPQKSEYTIQIYLSHRDLILSAHNNIHSGQPCKVEA